MINLITGLPGNAKTLYTIDLVIQVAVQENRAVYFAGLPEFKTDDPRLKGTVWIEFDPTTWYETVPSGAIIVVDEAQKIFRNRTLGTVPGRHVTELEEHRHKGIDMYLITQHPSLIDPAIRKLTQTHRHMVRVYGMEMSTVHLWRTGVRDDCDKRRGDSEKVKWAFNKELYGLYKSADVHTVKRQFPKRLIFLFVAPIIVLIALYAAAHYLMKLLPDDAQAESLVSNPVVQVAAEARKELGVSSGEPLVKLDDYVEYVRQNTPRVEGLPETAPKYDALTKPVRVPVPAFCIQKGSVRDGGRISCSCFTQQVTPMDVEFNTCISLARNGRFLDFDPDPQRREHDERRAERSAALLDRHPDVSMREPYGPAPVVAFNEVRPQLSEGVRPSSPTDTGPPNPSSRSALVRERSQ